MRTTSPPRHGDPAGQDSSDLAQDSAYDNPRRRRGHRYESEDDNRQPRWTPKTGH